MIYNFIKRVYRLFRRVIAPGKSAQKRSHKQPAIEKRYKKYSLKNIYDAVDFLRKVQVDTLNTAVEQRIMNNMAGGTGVIKIGFLVNERSKWGCQSLFEDLTRVECFKTNIYLSLLNRYSDYEAKKQAYLAEREYFMGVDKNLVDLYDWESDRELPLEDIDADILFFQQPWGMLDFPSRLVGQALCAYIHYGFPLLANNNMRFNIGSFHPYIWRYFEQTEDHKMIHLKHDPLACKKMIVTGYPKLDVYLIGDREVSCGLWKSSGEKRVIYAPHHSVGKDSIGISTFAWSGYEILDLARGQAALQWVYKPHPKLSYSAVKSKTMSKKEYHQYLQAWSELPNAAVYDSGSYFDIFRSSEALITDCSSFLAEYLPSGNPIIWLASEEHIGFNPFGDRLAECYYRVANIKELKEKVQSVIIEGNDVLKEKRAAAINCLFPAGGKTAAGEIVKYLKAYFNIG